MPGCMREPRRSAHRIGNRPGVATATHQIDQLDIEHDAGDAAGRTRCATCRRKPLNPHCVSRTGPPPTGGQHVERAAQRPAPRRLGLAHVAAVWLDPAAVHRVRRVERANQRRQLIGRCRHVRIGEDHQVTGSGQHPGAHGGAFAPVRHVRTPGHRRPNSGRALTRSARPVLAAVVDDQHVDRVRQLVGTRTPVARVIAAAVQIAEQLIERRAEASLLVVGRQNDGETPIRHTQSRAGGASRNRDWWASAAGTERLTMRGST